MYLVGAGPGDPGLVTLAAIEALRAADVVLYDALVSGDVLKHIPASCVREAVGKRAGKHLATQDEINDRLVELGRGGKRVVRLKGGDPFLFGRGGEEALACRAAGVPFTVVPGVTSAFGGPAYAGIPVTHRGASGDVYIASPAASSGIDYVAAARAKTVVLLMGATTLGQTLESIVEAGKDGSTPAAAIEWGTTRGQRVVRASIAELAEAVSGAKLGTPMLTVIGEVTALADDLAWFEPGPLAGRAVGVTRSEDDAGELAGVLGELGATVVRTPLLTYESVLGQEGLASVLGADWVLFTSARGVAAVWQALSDGGRDTRTLAGLKIACLPGATLGAVRAHHLEADFHCERGGSAGLAEGMPAEVGQRVVHICSDRAPTGLTDALAAKGVQAARVVGYRTVNLKPEGQELEDLLSCDAITFASPSAVESLAEALGGKQLPDATRLVSIGPTTSTTLRDVFGRVDAEAASADPAGLGSAVVEALTWA